MVKKILFILLCFLLMACYLHQKVMTYVYAYRLTDTYHDHNKLVDARDVLLYNFSKESSLARINTWVDAHGYTLAKREKIVALYVNDQKQTTRKGSHNIVLSSLRRLFRSTGISKAVAQEQR